MPGHEERSSAPAWSRTDWNVRREPMTPPSGRPQRVPSAVLAAAFLFNLGRAFYGPRCRSISSAHSPRTTGW
jgi:hypothetical protein